MKIKMTTIARRDLRIEPGEVTTIHFTGGPNPDDTGPKDFWTAFNEKSKVTVRWHHDIDPGVRFRMMEGEKGYEDAWDVARTATAIRPATVQEVIGWLNAHPKDTPFAESCQVAGQSMHLVKTSHGYQFE